MQQMLAFPVESKLPRIEMYSQVLKQHPITIKKKFQVGICLETILLNQIQNGRLATTIVFNVCNVWKSVTDTQQTRDTDPRLVQCWQAVYDVGPTLYQSWANVSCLLGS